MSVPNGGSVRLDEWPAVIPSGRETHNNSGDKSAHLLLC